MHKPLVSMYVCTCPQNMWLCIAIHVGEGNTDVPTLVIDIHRLVRGKDGGIFT